MFEELIKSGSIVGIGHISANTKTKMADSKNFESEVSIKFGIDSNRYPLTYSLNAFLGIAATFWLPIYSWICSTFWAAIVVFVGQLCLASFLSMIINQQGYYIFWRIAPLITLTGFVLTITSLF
jgi:hypothetical protein